MRLVIDLQGAQTGGGGRDIGAYSRSLAVALAAEAGAHAVTVMLNGAFPESTAALRDAFAPVLPPAQVRVWHGPGAQSAGLDADAPRRRAAERIRAGFLASLKPDLLLVTSVFEGLADDAVTSLPPDVNGPSTVSLCHDPAALLGRDIRLEAPAVRRFHCRGLLDLQHSAGLLTPGAASQAGIVAGLGVSPDRVASILAGVSPQFREASEADEPQVAVLARHGLPAGTVLCAGTPGPRMHLNEVIAAYALLPPVLRRAHPLVVTGVADLVPALRRMVAGAGLADGEVRLLTASIPASDWPALYRSSAVVVGPALHEGFAQPLAEAMACGAAVLGGHGGASAEVIGREDATFDPSRPDSIAGRLRDVLERPALRDDLRRHGLARAGLFTWPLTARRAWAALERWAPALTLPGLRRKPSLAVVTPLADGQPRLLQSLVRLSRDYAVTLVSADPAPADAVLATTFPAHPPGHLDGWTPDRLLFLPGDDPHHTALTIRLSFAFAGIVVAGSHPLTTTLGEGVGADTADLLTECLLDDYGWQGAVAARSGMAGLDRFPLEPGLRARSVAMLDADIGRITAGMIEQCYAANPRGDAEATAAGLTVHGPALPDVARALALTFAEQRRPALFLDVTTLAVFDAGTGIQRVVREITHQLGRAVDVPARVEPVRSTGGHVTLARAFGRSLYGVLDASPAVLPAAFAPGDVFVCLDLSIHDLAGLLRTIHQVRAGGGRAVVVIYDLLPVQTPHYFPEPTQRAFPAWLSLITAHCDGLLCISRTVADELLAWLGRHPPVRTRPLDIGWFHLGSDFNAVAASAPPPGRLELLMVGTVEPRKGHADALDAMEQVWRTGADVGLVIAGRAGWHTEALQARLHGHAEVGRRLRWLTEADDAQVSALYRGASALLMASEGEGFGLPIVEAAHAGLPVIARDIPVFREICGSSAVYFTPGRLADAIGTWLALHGAGQVPDPAGILAVSWADASRRMARIVLENDWYARWP